MPILQYLCLTHFKSYESASFDFSDTLNCIVGENGKGKTNLLDAVYYLCMTRSAFQHNDSLCIQHHQSGFTLFGRFRKQKECYEVGVSFQNGKKKILKCNQKEYEKLSEHIGKFPCVLICPYDYYLVQGGNEERRKFFDSIICQTNVVYMQNLLRYNQLLRQRNALLAHFLETNTFDEDRILPYDSWLVPLSETIMQHRKDFIQHFNLYFQEAYAFLTDKKEDVELHYQADVTIPFQKIFQQNLSADRQAGRTLKGIHKDEYAFICNGFSLKKFGSQGQQKSFIIALKLAEFAFIYHQNRDKPILLLDDIFDKLDEHRIRKLLQLIEQGTFGQVFIADASPKRTKALFAQGQAVGNFIYL
ncbi:MAG: DNA replication and repair protein RecF [Cytophagales bacterium]|nr:DNA replication and repair protein RecF [Cytophagales bacterium]MDW8383505.1 DNA replication and repair protein RecF [Flammeovirgaceae bacterium]